MTDRGGIFAGDDPFAIARAWLDEATPQELNDPNAMALATVDAEGLPNVRIVLLKDIEEDASTKSSKPKLVRQHSGFTMSNDNKTILSPKGKKLFEF